MFRKFILVLLALVLLSACAPRRVPAPLPPDAGIAADVRRIPARPVPAPLPPSRPPAAIAAACRACANDVLDILARPLPIPEFEMAPVPASPVQAGARRLPLIEYHYSTFRMGEDVRMETGWFASQLKWLHDNGFTTLSAGQLAGFIHGAYAPPARSVVLTFDVGASKFDDYANVVIPALRRYHFHGLFFILASRTLDSCDDPTITCWPKVKAWADEGLISVGSHSWSHRDYLTLTPEQIYFDAGRSRAVIEEKTGHPVLGICYPFDSVNPAAFDLLDSLGYQFAVGGYTRAERSATWLDPQPYNLPRYYPYSGDFYPLIGGTGGLTFDQMLMGAIEQ
jgi:peptidoglycan/xylan/chitin deacetylase (PgdA/CDA1 family)